MGKWAPLFITIAIAATAGCSNPNEPLADRDISSMMSENEAPLPNDEQRVRFQAEPQIAYSYGFSFRIDGENVAELQQAHIDMCDKMGDACQILRMSLSSDESWEGYGKLQLKVAADRAVAYGEMLANPANKLGGELVSTVRDGEDLSGQIIDTDAHLQSRLVLRDKLTGILQSSHGSLEELIEAERAIANINEEIDATRSKLQQFKNRIRYSDVQINYQSLYDSHLGFSAPVIDAIGETSTVLGTVVAFLIYIVTALFPIIVLILVIPWILRRFGSRLRFWQKQSLGD